MCLLVFSLVLLVSWENFGDFTETNSTVLTGEKVAPTKSVGPDTGHLFITVLHGKSHCIHGTGSIVTYISKKKKTHVGKYSIHGWYAYVFIYYTTCLFCGVLIVLRHFHRQSELRHIPLGIFSFATVERPAREDPKVVMVIGAKRIVTFKFNSGHLGMDMICIYIQTYIYIWGYDGGVGAVVVVVVVVAGGSGSGGGSSSRRGAFQIDCNDSAQVILLPILTMPQCNIKTTIKRANHSNICHL